MQRKVAYTCEKLRENTRFIQNEYNKNVCTRNLVNTDTHGQSLSRSLSLSTHLDTLELPHTFPGAHTSNLAHT